MVCNCSDLKCVFWSQEEELQLLLPHHPPSSLPGLVTTSASSDELACKYQCPFCPKGFSFKSLRDRHMCSHSNARPHACTLCDYSAKLRGNLMRHYRVVHSGNTTSAANSAADDVASTPTTSSPMLDKGTSNHVWVCIVTGCPLDSILCQYVLCLKYIAASI